MFPSKSGPNKTQGWRRRLSSVFRLVKPRHRKKKRSGVDAIADPNPEPRTPSNGDSDVDKALEEFKENYRRFEKSTGTPVVQIDEDELNNAITAANIEEDLPESSKLFETKIKDIVKQMRENQDIRNETWTGKLVTFLVKLYPLTRTSLQLTAAVAQVHSERRPLIYRL